MARPKKCNAGIVGVSYFGKVRILDSRKRTITQPFVDEMYRLLQRGPAKLHPTPDKRGNQHRKTAQTRKPKRIKRQAVKGPKDQQTNDQDHK